MSRKPGQDLTQGPVARSLFRLTAPMMLAVSSSIVVQMIEIGFIGQLGTAQIAAVTFTFPITMMLTSVAMGISIGTSSVIARRVGAGDWDSVRRLATHSLLLVGSLLSMLALVLTASIRPTFTALGAHGEVLDYIDDYLVVYYPGAVLFTVTMVAGSTMRATGDARIPGLIMTASAALNLALDPILIFGWFGLPALGLTGAAVAMVVSRLAMTALLLYFAAYRDRLFLSVRLWRSGILASWREVSVIGIPAMATQMIGPISGAVVTRLLASHGHDIVAGFGVAGRIEGVAVMLLFALSGSIGPFVGQNWGAGDHDRVRAGMHVAYRFSLAWGAFAWLVLIAIGDRIVPLIDTNPDVVDVARRYLAIVPFSYGPWGVLMMASAAFNSLGRPIPSTIMAFTRMFVLYVPLALIADRFYGYAGIFVATATANCVMGSWSYAWFKRAVLSANRASLVAA
jgi:putative MATE family efflux protein